MKRFTMAVALSATLALAGNALAVDVNFESGTEWDLGTWSDGTTSGVAFDLFGRDSGWDGGGSFVGAPVDPVAIIGAGDNVLYDGGIVGDFRWRNRENANGGEVRVEGGGKLELRASVAEDGEWIQYDAARLTVTGEGSELNRTATGSTLNGGAFTFGSWRSYDGMQTVITVDDGAKFTGEGQLWFGAYNDSERIDVSLVIGENAAVSYSGGLAGGISLDDTAGAGNEGDINFIYNVDERAPDPDADPPFPGGTGETQLNNYAINFTGVNGSLTLGENGLRLQKETEIDVWESTLASYEELWDMGILQSNGISSGNFSDYFAVENSVGEADYKLTATALADPGGTTGDPDLNFDGNVDGLDLGILLGAWDPAVAASMGIQGAVPEPTSAVLLMSACCLLGLRRRA